MRSVDIFGPFTGPTGYDNIVRGFVKNMALRGVHIALQNFEQWSGFKIKIDPLFEKFPRPAGGGKVHLSFCLPPQAVYSENQFSALYTMFEGTCVNPEWAQMASSFDMLIMPCEASISAFENAGVRRSLMVKVPIGIDTRLYNLETKPLSLRHDKVELLDELAKIERYPIRVMNIQELGPRKNVEGLIKAWILGTLNGHMKSSSCLILKLSAYSPNRYNKLFDTIRNIRREVGVTKYDHAPIFVSCRMFGEEEMPSYLASCTHYISMSRGEGWDLPAIQAAAMGKHLIVPDHSSYLEWCDECRDEVKKITELKKEKAEADGALAAIYSKAEWFLPSTEQAASLIASLEKPVSADTLLAKHVRKRYSWDAVTDKMIDVLDRHVWKHEIGTPVKDISEKYQNSQRGGKEIPKIICFWTQNLNKPCGIADYTKRIVASMLSKSKNVGVVGGSIRAHDMMVAMNRYALENIEFEYQFAAPKRLAISLQTLRERGIKSVVTMHTFSPEAEQHNRAIFKFADKIFVHNEATVREIAKAWLPTEKVVVAPMPMPKLISSDEVEKLDYTRIKTDKFVVGFYGFMYFHKGLEKLVDAFAELRKTRQDSLLLIVASKPQNTNDDVAGRVLDKLKEYGLVAGKDYVWISDFIADERKAIATLSQSDVVVLPYDDYGSFGASAAIGSALATGKPTIVSPTVWFDHVPIAVRFDNEKRSLAELLRLEYAMSKMALSSEHVDALEARSKRIAEFVEEHSAEKVADWHFNQYRQLLGTLP